MEVIGRLIQLTPERRGESARGPWVTGGFVIETEEQFARKIAFDVWGEDRLIAIKNIPLGSQIKVTFSVESREYNQRWYTTCRCNNVETFTSAMGQNPYGQQGQSYPNQMQGYSQPMNQGQMPQQQVYQQPPQQSYQQVQQQPPVMQEPAPQYQQPPQAPQSMGGTIEQNAMPEDGDNLPF